MLRAASQSRKEAIHRRTKVELATGTVIAEATGDWDLDELCGFAARNNAKRGFLVVSKVLGRHVPVKPSTMRRTFHDLSALIDGDLPGPVLFIGMAETAICLGQGVHEEYVKSTGRTDVVTMHSTRQEIDGEVMLRFEEPHSHASAHLLYEPTDPEVSALVHSARSLVLVDDEVSTGTTFSNLANAIRTVIPSIDRIVTVTLADWTGDRAYLARMPAPADTVSLVRGSLEWVGRDGAVKATVSPPAKALGRMAVHRNLGRTGRTRQADDMDHLADRIDPGPEPRRILVLGTGEFTYAPFRLAEILEERGHDVTVQATTRSPVHIGGAVGAAVEFSDNYGTPVANYLYNQVRDEGRVVIVCHETPKGSVDQVLLDGIGATALAMGADI